MIKKGCQVDFIAKATKTTVLMKACEQKMSEVAHAILEHDCNPLSIDVNNVNAFGCACKSNMPKVALKLMQLGAEPITFTSNGYSALIWACEHGMIDVARALLEPKYQKVVQINKQTVYGCTALNKACRNNMPKVALKLLQLGCNPNENYRYADGSTSLIWACRNGMGEVVHALLETNYRNAVHVNHKNRKKCSAFGWSCKNSMPTVSLKLLRLGAMPTKLKSYSGNTSLMWACRHNMVRVSQVLLRPEYREVVQIDHTNENGNSALVYACRNLMVDVAVELAERGVYNDKAFKEACSQDLLQVMFRMKGINPKVKHIQSYVDLYKTESQTLVIDTVVQNAKLTQQVARLTATPLLHRWISQDVAQIVCGYM
jgi:ankyrin repeat protein